MDKEMAELKYVSSGTELDEFCFVLGYSIDMLAEELEVSRATIFNWKKDLRTLPRIVSLALLALRTDPRLRKMGTQDKTRSLKPYRRSSNFQTGR